ncbi:NAD-dependent epimerase/dehydratase [Gloeothece citriformis PCC 7424]|uniref:NAD-dependent epimerase/dehydratase n=1 Tax=Gloeothece citriformis (strain PCC 7424) TaxID=65393 RepID=B7KJF8_GLOC7|nr:NAD(P)-dependent oxidoreductase [Gloeothece citriformis]ACK73635.1 NAD-dependent epimerase/dehydratase [Gloeothece citriformis PCC 7424]
MTVVFVTGASGFLGQYLVVELLRQNYQVRAVIRPASSEKKFSWHNHPNVELVRLDLRQKRGITEALQGVDAVIHLAATKAGDFYTQFAGTVVATENLLEGMIQAGVKRLVAISTFSVYDWLHIKSGQLVDENAPLDKNPIYRDEYAQTKLIQEELIREFEKTQSAPVTIIRPGMIYGRDNLWHAHLGAELGDNLWLKIGENATLPLSYVENSASAIVAALNSQESIGQTLNILDDDLPTQKVYLEKLLLKTPQPPRMIPISWPVMRTIVDLMWFYNQKFLKGQAKFPGIFVPAKLHPRFKPYRFTNRRAKEILNWTPAYSLDVALDRSCSDQDLLEIAPVADQPTLLSKT